MRSRASGETGGRAVGETPVTQEADRFVISVNGTKAALTMFADHDGRRVFFHTETKAEFGGRGLATQLIREVLDQTRERGLRVVPLCPMVAKFVSDHAEYGDMVEPPTGELNEWVRRHLV